MTLLQLVVLVPPMCRMAADPELRQALAAHSEDAGADFAPLAAAMARHPEDAQRVMTLLGSGDPPTTQSLRRRFSREALAFFHLCGQCTPEELLCVLTRCTVTPTAEAVALMVGEHRREEAVRQYALRMLWHLGGDISLPDPTALFPAPTPPRSAADVTRDTLRRLKEVHP